MIKINDVIWQVTDTAHRDLGDDRAVLGRTEYSDGVTALRKVLCSYFEDKQCSSKASSISPMGQTSNGGKILKVRWRTPGSGKSGGLRLVVVAYCTQKRVVVCRAFRRKEDPSEHEVRDAAELAPK